MSVKSYEGQCVTESSEKLRVKKYTVKPCKNKYSHDNITLIMQVQK